MTYIISYPFTALNLFWIVLFTLKTCVLAFSLSSSSLSSVQQFPARTCKAYHPTCTLRRWETASWKLHSYQDNKESDPSNDDDDDDSDEQDESSRDDKDDLSWISKAMNLSSVGTDDEDINSKTKSDNGTNRVSSSHVSLQSGISGFAIDSQLGFVCILSPDGKQGDDGDDDEEEEEDNKDNVCSSRERFTFVTVSPLDTDNLSSPEALCLIQLAGGLDLGAAVFPPETLASIVRNELVLRCDDDDEEENEKADTLQTTNDNVVPKKNLELIPDVQDLRSKVTLLAVTSLPNEAYNHEQEDEKDDEEDNAKRKQSASDQSESINASSDPKRTQGILANSPKILAAVQNLPGLTKITLEQVIQAMKLHADSDGQLNQRESFSELLDTLRTGKGGYGTSRKRWDEQRIKFKLTVSLTNDGDLTLMDVDKVPPFQAIALALRYKVPVTVSRGCFQERKSQGEDDETHVCQSVKEAFPSFKPMQELIKDARVMDGLISSMFFKESASDDDIRD